MSEGKRRSWFGDDLGDAEEIALARGCVRERGLLVEARLDLVGAEHVAGVAAMRKRGHRAEIELLDLLDVLDDRAELAAERVELAVRNGKPGKLGHVRHFLAIDHEN